MSQVSALAGVASGTIAINGVDFAIDPTAQSLQGVLDAINASAADVTASFADDRVTIVANLASSSLVLEEGGTGFWDALGIVAGTYDPETTDTGDDGDGGDGGGDSGDSGEGDGDGDEGDDDTEPESVETTTSSGLGRFGRLGTSRIGSLFGQFSRRFSGILRGDLRGSAATEVVKIRSQLAGVVRSSIAHALEGFDGFKASGGRFDTGLGVSFDFSESALDVISIREDELQRALRSNSTRVRALLFAESKNSSPDGVMVALVDQLKSVESSLRTRVGDSTSLVLDARA